MSEQEIFEAVVDANNVSQAAQEEENAVAVAWMIETLKQQAEQEDK